MTGLLESKLGTAFRVALTFTAVSLAWVSFRPDLHDALVIFGRMFAFDLPGKSLPLSARGLWYTAAVVLACHALVASGWWAKIWAKLPAAAVGYGYALLLIAALLLAPEQGQGFLYFSF